MRWSSVSVASLAVLLSVQASASTVTVFSDNPNLFGVGEVTRAQPRSGNGSVDLSVGDYLVYEFYGGPNFGTFGDLDYVGYESLVTSATNPYRVELALRFYDYGDPRTFFLATPGVLTAQGTWLLQSVLNDLFIQAAEGNTPPGSLADIPDDAPITGIHLRAAHWSGPWVGYADNVTLGLAGDRTTYNFESVPEPTSLLLLMGGIGAFTAVRRRAQRRQDAS